MKKITSFLVIILLASLFLSAQVDKRFSVGVFATIPMGKSLPPSRIGWNFFEHIEKYNKTFWKAGIEGGYTLPIYKRLIFQPTVSINYNRHNGFMKSFDGGGRREYMAYINEIQLDVCAPVGVYFKISKIRLDLGTGPLLGCYLYQENHDKHNYIPSDPSLSKTKIYDTVTYNETRRLSFYWRSYTKCNFKKEAYRSIWVLKSL